MYGQQVIKPSPYLIPLTAPEKNDDSMNESKECVCSQTGTRPFSKSDFPCILVEPALYVQVHKPAALRWTARSCDVEQEVMSE